MCGIAGAVWTDPDRALASQVLERMVQALRHRGPDEAGAYERGLRMQPPHGTMPGVALGHRRLSIIDVAGGHQPLANEDGSVWVTFNGEIYNHRALRSRLEGAGHAFRTQSDTETIVHLYEDEGLDFVDHLNGMFALAIWDARQRRLVLARDRLGEKPLYYRVEPGRLLFASELKSLLQVPGVERTVDPAALDAYLTYGYVPHPFTIFRGISKLAPAERAVFADGQFAVARYWQPDFEREDERPMDDYAAELSELMTSAVQMRLESDVPLGAFLSGGVDSALVVGLMQRLSNRPVKTFSIGFGEREFDETADARSTAERLGTEHHQFRVEPNSVELLPLLAWHYDEPLADSSAVPTYYVSKLTREHVTVALTGDGGDELFGGYLRYRAVQWASRLDWLPPGVRRLAAAGGSGPAQGGSRSLWRRAQRFASGLNESPARRYYLWMSLFDDHRRRKLFGDALLSQAPTRDPFAFLDAAMSRAAHRDPVSRAALADVITYLPCDLLAKVDIASMANGLECRAPLLDHRVVELAARMPIGCKLRGGMSKVILQRSFPELLPNELMRRPKRGFAVPLAAWFRGTLGEYARDVLLDPRATARGYFRTEVVRDMLQDHRAGRADHGYRLWGLLFLELWQRQWIDQPPAIAPPAGGNET
jgi:asparagine synthase (glutamine-hydrolysing)